MDNVSILDQILDNQKAEEVAKLDAVEIINNLFSELSDRERDVLIRRYGLHGSGKETLESIGNAHSLTRERIRQIETTSVKKLQNLQNLNDHLTTLKKVINQLLEEHGGIMEKEYMLNILVDFSLSDQTKSTENEKRLIHKNYLNFLITKLLYSEFEELLNSKHFKESYKLRFQELDHLEEILLELLTHVKEKKAIHTTDEIINLIHELETFEKHKENIVFNNSLDISRAIESEFYSENSDLINSKKPLYSLLKAAHKIEQNKFGHWGVHNSREIKPKTINDKIFLILKNYGKPMHFADIAEKINSIAFDQKLANAATVHNELILDKKYVLVGRGLYGLKEWGYKKGTVAEVIEEIIRNHEEPLSREAIIDKVLEKRMVKKATIILALMNKDKFGKKEGKYTLIES